MLPVPGGGPRETGAVTGEHVENVLTELATDDVVALWRLQARYADVVTRRAWPELNEIFLPDAPVRLDLVTAPPRRFVGPTALGEFIATAVSRFDHFQFVILNAVVDRKPDERRETAWGRMFIREIRHEITTGQWHDAYGVYEDSYLKRDGRWWMAARHYRSMARTGPEEAIFGVPPTAI